jgi:hypothetical protein
LNDDEIWDWINLQWGHHINIIMKLLIISILVLLSQQSFTFID